MSRRPVPACSSRISEPSSNLDGSGPHRAEMSPSEICPPTECTICLNSQHFSFSSLASRRFRLSSQHGGPGFEFRLSVRSLHSLNIPAGIHQVQSTSPQGGLIKTSNITARKPIFSLSLLLSVSSKNKKRMFDLFSEVGFKTFWR